MTATLSETMGALQRLGDAVSGNRLRDYRDALTHAREIGVTEEQIKDAWKYRATKRLTETYLSPVSFDHNGEVR